MTRAAKKRVDVKEVVGKCLEVFSVEVSAPHEVQATWRGITYAEDNIPDSVKKEVLYDLYEHGFYFDLLLLDQMASGKKDPALRSQYIRGSLAIGWSLQYPADMSFANKGLFSQSQQDRLTHLVILRRLMQDWEVEYPRPHALTIRPTRALTEPEIVALEAAVAEFYTAAFYEYFGRAAIVPHRL